MPWDDRIHSSSKKKNQDGTWKKRRGVSQEDYDRVVAELTGPIKEPQQQPVERVPTDGFGGDPYAHLHEQQNPAAVFGGQQIQAPVDTGDLTWPALLAKIVRARNDGALDEGKLFEMMKADEVKGGIPMLAHRKELWGKYVQELSL
jgi:hypothetical protein